MLRAVGRKRGEETLSLQSPAGTRGRGEFAMSSSGDDWNNGSEVSRDDDEDDYSNDGYKDESVHSCLLTTANACNCECHQENVCGHCLNDEVEVAQWYSDYQQIRPTDKELIKLLTRRVMELNTSHSILTMELVTFMASLRTWISKDGKNHYFEMALDEDDISTSVEGDRILKEFRENLEEDKETYHLDFLFGQGNYTNVKI